MKERMLQGQRGIAASAEAKNSESPVIIRTWSGFEVWLDTAADEVERTESGEVIYRFAVTSPQRQFGIIRVEIPSSVQDHARQFIGPSFIDDLSLWHALAHDALADALDQCPSVFETGHFTLGALSPQQLDIARRWGERW